jgi:hypothetical protein
MEVGVGRCYVMGGIEVGKKVRTPSNDPLNPDTEGFACNNQNALCSESHT